MSVWTLTPNPALDFTYRISELTVGVPHRITNTTVRPGGKGVNVSRVLASLGIPTTATGFLGGANGARFESLLRAVDRADLISTQFQRTTFETRISIAVVDDNSDATVLNEAGETPTDNDWDALLERLREGLKPGDVLACCGSFPGSSDPEWMTKIVETAHSRNALVLVDATGRVLKNACEAGVDLVKPNDLELRETTGKTSVIEGAHELLRRGVGIVITSEGAKGMSIHGPDGSYHAAPERHIEGNPTGAGDASVAAWCAYITGALDIEAPAVPLQASDLKAGLPYAVALSGATVAMPVAGEVDLTIYNQMKTEIEVETL